MTLEGRAALVTGASGAMGGAIALSLAREGVALVLSGRSEERLERTAASSRAEGVEVVVLARDLTEDRAVEALASRAEDAFGGIDLLVHALGTFHAGEVAETPGRELDEQLEVNLRVPWALTRRLLPGLEERRGEIVFVNSSVGLGARGGVGAYAASKQALRALADSLRDEVNPAGVRVLTVYPGRTASAMQREVRRLERRSYEPERLIQPEDIALLVLACVRLPRTAEVTDLTVRPMQKP